MRRLVCRLRHGLLPALRAPTVSSACSLVVCIVLLSALAPSAAATVDLSSVELRLSDFPSEFRAVSKAELADTYLNEEDQRQNFEPRLRHASLEGYTVFADKSGSEFVESFVLGPLTKAEVRDIDAAVRDRKGFFQEMVEGLSASFATAGQPRDLHVVRVADVAAGASITVRADEQSAWVATALGGKAKEGQAQFVLGRRGQYVLLAILVHAGADQPRSDIVKLAGILDRRLARAQGIGGESEFVASVPLPTEVSRDPAVIGTNLALALLFALGFGFTSTLFNSTLRENHDTLRRWVDPVLRPFSAAAGKLRIGSTTGAAPRSRARRLLEPISIVVLAALIYSFLDPTFGFSTQGLQLFLSLLVSVAVVTFLYEGVQTRLCSTRFHTPAALRLYPAALLVAVACVVASRLVGFSPGYLYGFVGAMAFLTAAEPTLACRGRMVLIASAGLLAVSVGTWFLAVPLTNAAQGGGWLLHLLQGMAIAVFVAGLESVFFGLIPLSFMDGESLLRWRKPIWLALFAVVAFMFWHVLLNKNSQYAAAFGGQSTRVMVTLLAAFTVLTLVSYFYFRRRRSHIGPVVVAAGTMMTAAGPMMAAARPAIAVQLPATSKPTGAAAVSQTSAATLSVEPESIAAGPAEANAAVSAWSIAAVPAGPIAAMPAGSVPAEGAKTCPVCGASIRAAARLCRFCRAPFELRRFGYCAACRDVVGTDEAGACCTCGAETGDEHIVTLLTDNGPPLSPVAAERVLAAVAAGPSAAAAAGAAAAAAARPAPGPSPAAARRAKAARTAALLDERRRALGIPTRRLHPLAIVAGLTGIAAGCGLFWAWSLTWYEESDQFVLFYENPPALIACGVGLVIFGIATAICQRWRAAVLCLGLVSIVLGCLAVYVTMMGRSTLADSGIDTGSMFRVALGLSVLAIVPGVLALVASLRMHTTRGRSR